ncbi:hypothetical protein GQR58_011667 [Nymphon striatum]|nr:hypothetical protein GQR58_011667 [Nymphon striatum]
MPTYDTPCNILKIKLQMKNDKPEFADITNLNCIKEQEQIRVVTHAKGIFVQTAKQHDMMNKNRRQLQDCVVRVPYDTKVKRKTIQMAEKFQPVSSDLTLKERKEARSLRSVDLSDAEIGNRRNALAHCLEWLLEKDINGHIESLSAVSTLLECIRTDCEQQDKDSVVRHVGQVLNHLNSLLIVWEEFENSLGKTAKLWGMYIDMVLISKRYINAERALEATPR